jgi:hypothetical protein
VKRKQQRAGDKKYIFPLPSDEDTLFNMVLPLSRNRAKLNKQILETGAEFVTPGSFKLPSSYLTGSA